MSPSNPSNVTVLAHADMALAQRCASGDPGGFEELYRVYSPRLFGLACRMVGRTEAEDWLQEIFPSAHRKIRGTRVSRRSARGCSGWRRTCVWIIFEAGPIGPAQATDSIDADTVHQPEGGKGSHPRRDRPHRSRTGAG